MNPADIPLFFSFLFGVLSIISPCVLILLPAYLATIAGMNVGELQAADVKSMRRRVMGNALAFVVGFFLVFIPLGALLGVASQAIGSYRQIVGVVAGMVILLLGANMLWPLPFMRWTQIDARIRWRPGRRSVIGNIFFGATFAFVWTPCVGPYLLGVIAFVGVSGNVLAGVGYFAMYSLGLASALLAFAYLVGKFIRVTDLLKKYMRPIERASGILLMVIGVAMVTNQLYLSSAFLSQAFGDFQPERWFIK